MGPEPSLFTAPSGPVGNTANRSLSVIVPAYDEEAGVPALVDALSSYLSAERRHRVVELVLIDDGSTDRTAARLQAETPRLAPHPVCVVRHNRNQGLTAALATGFAASHGDLIGWLDADLTYTPDILTPLAAACDAGADVALASCYHEDGRVEGVAGWRLALSKVASAGHRWASGHREIRTFTSMVRVWRRDVLAACLPQRGGFLGIAESLHLALRGGFRVEEVPAVLRRRRTGSSKMRVARAGLGHLRMMWTERRRRARA